MSLSDAREKIWENSVEILSAITMVVVGMFLIIGTNDVKLSALGGALTTVGGILLSWTAAQVNSDEQAASILRPRIEVISRHLGSLAGQLGTTLSNVQSGVQEPATGFALVAQARQILYTLVTDLQQIVGSPFNPRDLVETSEKIDDLVIRLSEYSTAQVVGVGDEEDEEERVEVSWEIADELLELNRKLKSQLAHLGAPTEEDVKRNERVECPECGSIVDTELRVKSGSSSSPHCENCGLSFHAHRRGDGTVFTRRRGATSNGQPSNPYLRILKDQGIRMVPAKFRPIALRNLARIFEDAPNGRVPSFETLDEKLNNSLKTKGYQSNLLDVKKVRQLLYRAKGFQLLYDEGIALGENVDSSNIVEYVDRNLLVRILQFTGGDFDPQCAVDLLYAGDKAKLEYIENIAADLNTEESDNDLD